MPIIAIRFAFDGGRTQDPAGKEGLVNLMTGLFDEGAGDLDSEAFQTARRCRRRNGLRRRPRRASMASMRMLAEQKDAALRPAAGWRSPAALRPGADRPHPLADRVRHHRQREGSRDERRRPNGLRRLYGDHPYARPDEGTRKTLATITAEDLRAFHKAIFARERPACRGGRRHRRRDAGARSSTRSSATCRKSRRCAGRRCRRRSSASSSRSITTCRRPRCSSPIPASSATTPDFFAALLMNQILGGGTFTSRLFNEVREKRGLAYSVDSVAGQPRACQRADHQHGDPLRPRGRDAGHRPRRGQAHGRGGRRPRRNWRRPRNM